MVLQQPQIGRCECSKVQQTDIADVKPRTVKRPHVLHATNQMVVLENDVRAENAGANKWNMDVQEKGVHKSAGTPKQKQVINVI